jgi:general secretion pathway protein D
MLRGTAGYLAISVAAGVLSAVGPPGATSGPALLAATTAQPPGPQRHFTLNFQDAPIESVIQALGRVVGLNYVLAPQVGGRVTVETTVPLPADVAFDVLGAILETHGFAARAVGPVYQIVRAEDARSRGTPVVIGREPPARPDEEIVTQLVPLGHVGVGEMVAAIRSFVSPRGHAAAHGASNLLIITDTVANLRRVLEIVRVLEFHRLPDELAIVPLQIAEAGEAAAALGGVLAAAGPGERATLIVADRRSNTLVALGRTADLDRVRRLAAELDAKTAERPQLFVYRPEHRKAEELGAIVRASDFPLRGAARVVADPSSNVLLVSTAPHRWTELAGLLRDLDGSPRQVSLTVVMAELMLTDETRVGVDWAALGGGAGIVSLTGVVGSLQTVTPLPDVLSARGLTVTVVDANRFAAVLNAFAAAGRVNLSAAPSVVAADGRTAVINVSESVPVVVAQPSAAGEVAPAALAVTNQQIEYKDVGVILKATPKVGHAGTVALEVRQELSELGAIDPVLGAHEVLKREVQTAAVLREGQALVLGGLLRERTTTEETGVPFLKDIPVVGALFRTRATTRATREFVFVITPRVLPTLAP